MYVVCYVNARYVLMSKLKRKTENDETADLQKVKKSCEDEETDNNNEKIVISPYFDSKANQPAKPGTSNKSENSDYEANKRLPTSFYRKSCLQLAKDLLGQILVRQCPTSGDLLCGRIVETEAYLGTVDKAAHSYKGKKTDKNSAMFMDPGTAYVYNIYGMYCCFNVSSEGEGAAVLLRALEPVKGLETMTRNRSAQRKGASKALKSKELCNGPSKFCQALAISKITINKQDLVSSPDIWIVAGEKIDDQHVVTSPRINIGYAEDWKDKPYRFYVLDNNCVSVRDKSAEAVLRAC